MYNDLMGHWFSLLRENIYSIRYEEIVQDLVKQSKDLLDYCDLEWEEACLNFHRLSEMLGLQVLYRSDSQYIVLQLKFGKIMKKN